MKKIITYLVCILMLFGLTLNVFAGTNKKTETKETSKEKTETKKETKEEKISCANEVNIHLFWGNGCPHCEAAIEYLTSIDEEYGHCFNLVKYEVWYDKENSALMKDVAGYFGEEVSGVPYIVVGEKTFSGYSEKMNEDLLKAIENASNDEEYIDVVEKVQAGEFKNKSSVSDTIITIAIISIIIGGVAALVATSKSK